MASKWARVENGKVREIIDFNPEGRYHPSIFAQFVECDDTVEQHFEYKNNKFNKTIPIEVEPQPIKKEKIDKLIEKLIKKGIISKEDVD